MSLRDPPQARNPAEQDSILIIEGSITLKEYSLQNLQKVIGYTFHNQELLRQSLIHSSYTNEAGLKHEDCNERLEFLGDAVLELTSSEFLYKRYPHKKEGELTTLRASIVCEPTLALCAREIELGEYLIMGRGEAATGGRKRDSITSDAMEAVLGAIYLDGGLECARAFAERFILNDIEQKHLFYDSKTILQETAQKITDAPLAYEITGEEGPEHDKSFTARVLLGGRELGSGRGHTKKAAHQMAAYQALLRLKKQKPEQKD